MPTPVTRSFPDTPPSSRGIGDFFASLVSVQQENGRIILYVTVMVITNAGLLYALARLPAPDTYLVDGVTNVESTAVYWNQSDATIQRLISGLSTSTRSDAPAVRDGPAPGPVAPGR